MAFANLKLIFIVRSCYIYSKKNNGSPIHVIDNNLFIMNFIDAKIENYAMESSSAEPLHLQQLTRETNLKTYMPRMLSGHL